MSQFVYGEYVQGIRNRNRIERLPDFPDCFGRLVTDAYCSAFRFDQSIIEHMNKEKTVSGFRGPCRAIGLHFDFDSPHDDCSLREVRRFIEKILSDDKFNLTIEHLDTYYSGNKGFHIHICNEEIKSLPTSEKAPEQVKRLCTSLAGEFSSFDRSVYDRTRIFRLINSKHFKSGLFKIPLYPAEVFTLGLHEIRDLAKKQRRLSETATIHHFLKRCNHAIT